MSEVATGGEIESHDAIVRAEQGGVHREVRRGPRVGLDIYTPLLRAERVGSQRALLAEQFDLIHIFLATIVALARVTFAVFVREGGTETGHNSFGSQIFGGNELKSSPLAILFTLNEFKHFGIMVL
jgi:hypothetical protein